MSDQDLVKRVQALEDERGVLRAIRGFAHYLDHGVVDKFVDIWTEDGVFEVRDRHDNVSSRQEGREGFARMAGAVSASKYVKRLPTTTMVTLDGDAAHAESYFTRFDERDEKSPYVYAFGRYFDHLVRCADGIWRIKHRLARVDAEVGTR